jgi:LacI family transcriptional regulator
MPVTMRDVALAAGVSIKTVSRVVNQQGEISLETQRRVQAAIDQLGYRPNRVAQGLVTNRTHTIGLVLANITNPYVAEVAHSIQETIRNHGYNMFLCNSSDDPLEEIEALQSLSMQGVDGIILFPTYRSHENLAQFAVAYRPLVLFDGPCEHPNVATIQVDLYRGGCLAVEHLIERGHRAIGMLSEPVCSIRRGKRRRAFQETLTKHGLPGATAPILYAPPTAEGGYISARQLLQQEPSLTAIFAQNDLMAFGAIRACMQASRRIPHDCAVVGFDDIYLAAMMAPALTTVRIDRRLLGRLAVERLMQMMANSEHDYPPIHLDVELIVREST